MLSVCPLIDGAYPITSKEDAAATNPSVVAVNLRTGATLATLTVAGGAVTSSGNFWICDLNHSSASAVQTHLQRTQNAHVRLTWGLAAAGGGADQTEEITSNTAEHDAALYPDGFIFCKAGGATVTAFSYGNGSTIEPAGELEYGAVCSVARGSPKKFDISGTFGGSSGNGVSGGAVGAGAGIGTEYNGAYVRCRTTCSIYPEIYGNLDVQDAFFDGAITWNSFQYLTTLNCNGTYFKGGAIKSSTKWIIRGGTWDSCTIEDEFEFNFWNFDMVNCTFKGALIDFAASTGAHSGSAFPIVSCIGDFTLANVSTSVTFQVIGHKAGTITTSGTQPSSISLSGSYQLVNSAGWTIASNLPSALQADFSANITNLAASSITPTEAPNLDVAVSSVAGGGAADWSTAERNQIRYRLSLDGAQANPSTSAGDMETLVTAALSMPSATQNADAVWDEAYSGHTAAGSFGKLLDTLRKSNLSIEGQVSGTPTATTFDTTLTEVTGAHDHQVILFVSGALLGESRPIDTYNSTNGQIILQEALTAAPAAADEFVVLAQHVHPIADIQNGLATSAAVSLVTSNVQNLLSRLDADDIAIIKGLLLGNYRLDGSAGSVAPTYTAEGCMTTGRVRVFETGADATASNAGAANDADNEIARIDVSASAVAGQAYPGAVTSALTLGADSLATPFADWLATYSAEDATGAGPYQWAPQTGTGPTLTTTDLYTGSQATLPMSNRAIGAARVDRGLIPGASGFASAGYTWPAGAVHMRCVFKNVAETNGNRLFSWTVGATDLVQARWTSATGLTLSWQDLGDVGSPYSTSIVVPENAWHLLDLVVDPTGGAGGVAKMNVYFDGLDLSPTDGPGAIQPEGAGDLGVACRSNGTSPVAGPFLFFGIRPGSAITLAVHQQHASAIKVY